MRIHTLIFALCAFIGAASAQQGASAPEAGALPAAAGVTGGLVVQVGCGTGEVLAQWGKNPALLIHGLDRDAQAVEQAKARLDALGLYGRVSAERFDGKNLPYGDNLVNLMVLSDPASVTAQEVKRALTPNGTVLAPTQSRWEATGLERVQTMGPWVEYRKPRAADLDDWTHFLHDASGNAVSHDRQVGDPHHLQWYAGPDHTRHHDTLASMSAMTSSGGRVFYIYDEGEISVIYQPSRWKLIARDAFNGKLLWKRDIPDWMTHLYNFRAGPVELQRRLVSVGDRVFVTLGFTAPVAELDAATGRTLRTYEGSAKTEELLYHDGMLLVTTGDPEVLIEKSDGCYGYWEMAEEEEPTADKSIKAYDTKTGRELWAKTGPNLRRLVPLSLCALGSNVFYLDNDRLHCLDSRTGNERWAAPFATEGWFIRSYAPTVVAHDDVVLCLYWNRFCGFSIKDGRQLWEQKGAMGFGSPADLFVIDGKAWTLPETKAVWRGSKTDSDGIVRTGLAIPKSEFINNGQPGTAVAVDLHTGKIVDTVPFAENQHHHRCHRDKATDQYLLVGFSGVQLVDLRTKTFTTNQWVRGLCQYGFMPANGMLYMPPDPCRCKTEVKVNGFVALASSASPAPHTAPSLERGPAFAQAASLAQKPGDDAWPTYRANAARTGGVDSTVPASPTVRWKAKLGSVLTAPVVASDRLLVADRDGYAVSCLDATTGARRWKHLADGPVDSPPTIVGGLCVFGSADGSVTCLTLENGELVWRFRLPDHDRRIGAEDRLESPLPIHGSVLVLDGVVYFAAGRSSHLDGGLRLYGLEVRSGQVRYQTEVTSEEGKTQGALADILVSAGNGLGMRQLRFGRDLQQQSVSKGLVAGNGLLDGTWFHRTGWRLGNQSGKLIVAGAAGTFAVSNPYTSLKRDRKSAYRQYDQDGHFHIKFTRYKEEFYPLGVNFAGRPQGVTGKSASWTLAEPFQPRAMVLAGDKLCVAGWEDSFAIELKTGRPKSSSAAGEHTSALRLYAANTGERLGELPLQAPPVYDGMAAAYGRLFVSLRDGTLVCAGGG